MAHLASRRLDAVVFDLGSTLIYFDTDWPQVLSQADEILFVHLKAAGLDLNEQEFLPTFRTRLEAYYRERETEFIEYTTQYVLRILLSEWGYPDVPDSILRPALNAMYAVTQAHWQPEPDAVSTLQTLKEQGYRIGLISNAADDRDVQALIDKTGIRPYLERVLTSAAEGIRKPNPRIFNTLLKDWNVPPQRAAMVGDTLGADILGARNAGMFSIWITRRADNPANRAHADTIHPDATIATLAELPDLLTRLGAGNSKQSG